MAKRKEFKEMQLRKWKEFIDGGDLREKGHELFEKYAKEGYALVVLPERDFRNLKITKPSFYLVSSFNQYYYFFFIKKEEYDKFMVRYGLNKHNVRKI